MMDPEDCGPGALRGDGDEGANPLGAFGTMGLQGHGAEGKQLPGVAGP